VDGLPSIPPVPARNVVTSAQDAKTAFDLVFLAVQPPQLDVVMDSLEGRLGPGGRIVCLSNGLCEERLSERFGEEAIIGAVVGWGARMTAPGHYQKTSTGGFQVGTLSGETDDRLLLTADLLRHVAPVVLTNNLRGARFTKLAINCAVSTLGTIGGTTLGELLLKHEVRSLAMEILAEAVRIARAEGVVLEPVTNLDLDWLVPEERNNSTALQTAARHALLLAIGTRYRHLRSSMLAAIERGRTPAVDYLNGEICRRGRRLGICTPVNDAASQLVWDIAEGRRSAGMMAIRRVREISSLARQKQERSSTQESV
jgi:2-dehydropantoate 2-reductase